LFLFFCEVALGSAYAEAYRAVKKAAFLFFEGRDGFRKVPVPCYY